MTLVGYHEEVHEVAHGLHMDVLEGIHEEPHDVLHVDVGFHVLNVDGLGLELLDEVGVEVEGLDVLDPDQAVLLQPLWL